MSIAENGNDATPPADRDALQKAIATARAAAIAHSNNIKAQINHYWQYGPVPPVVTKPVTDFIEAMRQQNRAIALILTDNPPVFDWTSPPTEQSIKYNQAAAMRWEALKRPKPRGRNPTDKPVIGATEYGLKALDDEIAILAKTDPGGNDQLNISALKLGQLIATGDLPEDLVVAELWETARQIGLPEHTIVGRDGNAGTLYSGLNTGKRQGRRGRNAK
jgi:hypothetical protein